MADDLSIGAAYFYKQDSGRTIIAAAASWLGSDLKNRAKEVPRYAQKKGGFFSVMVHVRSPFKEIDNLRAMGNGSNRSKSLRRQGRRRISIAGCLQKIIAETKTG